MSIPMRFELYDSDGNFLRISGCMTRSYSSKSGDLTAIRKRFFEATEDFIKFEGPEVRYIVSTESPDYMFDAKKKFMIMPNKFR